MATSKNTARNYLDQLGYQSHDLYRSDPVQLLGTIALAYQAQHGPLVTDLRIRSSQDTQLAAPAPAPVYKELARTVVPSCGYLDFAVGDARARLTIPNLGLLNVLVLQGEWPLDPRPFCHGCCRLQIAPGAGTYSIDFAASTTPGVAVLTLPTPPDTQVLEFEVKAYEEPGSGPDLTIKVAPRKQLNTPAIFVG